MLPGSWSITARMRSTVRCSWLAAVTPSSHLPLVYGGYGVLYGLALTLFTTLHAIF